MEQAKTEDIINFLRSRVEPLTNNNYGNGYRAAATLIDGVILPCVIFRNPTTLIDLAVRRFKEEKSGKSVFSKSSGFGYREIVKTFVTKGNCINDYEIATIQKTEFAFPSQVLKKIEGETKMGWTGFVAKMKDGKQFAFGTTFNFEFFNMPEGYSTNDISEIINHSYLDKEGNIKSYHTSNVYETFERAIVYRERPFFECFIDGL